MFKLSIFTNACRRHDVFSIVAINSGIHLIVEVLHYFKARSA